MTPSTYTVMGGWLANRASNIASNAQHRRIHAHQRRLSARASSRRQLAISRIHRRAVDVVRRL